MSSVFRRNMAKIELAISRPAAYNADREGGFFYGGFPIRDRCIPLSGQRQLVSCGCRRQQFAIVRLGSSNSNGLYVDPYFLQNVNGAHTAGLRVGAYYYTYAKTQAEVAKELTLFLDALEGLQLEYPVFVDVEANSLTSLSRSQSTELNLAKYAMDILYQRKWYAGWYSYTNFINSYLNAGDLSQYPLWVADYRSKLGYTGPYTMWQYSGSGTCDGVSGAVDLDYSYTDFLPAIKAGGFNNYGVSGPNMVDVKGYTLNVFGSRTEYFYTANVNDIVGYLPVGQL